MKWFYTVLFSLLLLANQAMAELGVNVDEADSRGDIVKTIIHEVKPGETFSGIGRDYKVKWTDIQADNGNIKPVELQIGYRLKISLVGNKELVKTKNRNTKSVAKETGSIYAKHLGNPVGEGADRTKFVQKMGLPEELLPRAMAIANRTTTEKGLPAIITSEKSAKSISGTKVFTHLDVMAYRTAKERKAKVTDGNVLKDARVVFSEWAPVEYFPLELNGKIYNIIDDPGCLNLSLKIEDAPVPVETLVPQPEPNDDPVEEVVAKTPSEPSGPTEEVIITTETDLSKKTVEEQRNFYQNLKFDPSGKARGWLGAEIGVQEYSRGFKGGYVGGRLTIFPNSDDFRVGGMTEWTKCQGRFDYDGRYKCTEGLYGAEGDYLDGDMRHEAIVGFGKYDGDVSIYNYDAKNTANLQRYAYFVSHWNDERVLGFGASLTLATDNKNMYSLDNGKTYQRGKADNQSRVHAYAEYFRKLKDYPNIKPGGAIESGYTWSNKQSYGKGGVGAEFYDTVKTMVHYNVKSGSKNDVASVSVNLNFDSTMDYLIDNVLMRPFKSSGDENDTEIDADKSFDSSETQVAVVSQDWAPYVPENNR